MARVVVGCEHGSEGPDSVVVAYLTAGAALDRGDEVVMWLTSEGVRLATNGYVAGGRPRSSARWARRSGRRSRVGTDRCRCGAVAGKGRDVDGVQLRMGL